MTTSTASTDRKPTQTQRSKVRFCLPSSCSRYKRFLALLGCAYLLIVTQAALAQLGGWIDKAKQKAQQATNGLGVGATATGYAFLYFPATSGGKSVEYYTPVFSPKQGEDIITTWGTFKQFAMQRYGAESIPGHTRSYYQQASTKPAAETQKQQRISEARNGSNGFAPAEIVETGWTPDTREGAPSSNATSVSGVGKGTPSYSGGASSLALSVSSSEGAYTLDRHKGGSSDNALRFNTELEGSLLGTAYRHNLLVMKSHPEIIDEYGHEMARWLLYAETPARRDMELRTGKAPLRANHGPYPPAYGFEWSALKISNATFANGPLIDVYLRPDADWGFLKEQPGWNDSEMAWVGAFVFPPALETPDKDSTYAAHDAAPLLEEQLRQAAKRESTELFYEFPLQGSSYDIDKQVIQFGKKDFLEPLPSGSPVYTITRAAYSLYDLKPGYAEVQRNPGFFRPSYSELVRWRELISNFKASADALALDRQLRLPDIPLDRSKAEAMHIGSTGGILIRLFITVERAAPIPEQKERFALVAKIKKVELVTSTGHELIANVPTGDAAVARQPTSVRCKHAFKGHYASERKARPKVVLPDKSIFVLIQRGATS